MQKRNDYEMNLEGEEQRTRGEQTAKTRKLFGKKTNHLVFG
jgi:hypothetical protein